MCGFLVALIVASGPAAGAGPLVQASNCGSRGCSWAIQVSPDGVVSIERPRAPHRCRRYRLSVRNLAAFKSRIRRERATELSGVIGDLTVDGPERSVQVDIDGRTSSFRLYTTPPGLGLLYRSDPSDVSRALRVCEAVRALGGEELTSCVDVR
jgi:hypothetical protein